MIGPSGAAYSVDSWLKRRRLAKEGGTLPPGVHPRARAIDRRQLLPALHADQFLHHLPGLGYLEAARSHVVEWHGHVGSNGECRVQSHECGSLSSIHDVLGEESLPLGNLHDLGVIFTLFVELGFPFLVWNRRIGLS